MTKSGNVKYIGNNVYHIRKNVLKMSQEQFGEKVGLSKDTISNIERGKYLPTISALVNISNAVNVPIDFFLHKLEE